MFAAGKQKKMNHQIDVNCREDNSPFLRDVSHVVLYCKRYCAKDGPVYIRVECNNVIHLNYLNGCPKSEQKCLWHSTYIKAGVKLLACLSVLLILHYGF